MNRYLRNPKHSSPSPANSPHGNVHFRVQQLIRYSTQKSEHEHDPNDESCRGSGSHPTIECPCGLLISRTVWGMLTVSATLVLSLLGCQ
jgi:hypothetical protein